MPQLALLCLLLWQSGHAAPSFPEASAFAAEVRRGLALGFDAQREFAYIERRRDVDISALGGVSVGPVRTFQVFPSGDAGEMRKRLIEEDGTPLHPGELARRDAEHERNVRRAAERRRRERPAQRAARLREEEAERREREEMLDDAVAVFEPVFAGHDRVDGHPVWIVDLRPRPDADVRTRQGEWMRHFEGRIWVSPSDYQIVRLEMEAVRDVTVGWGVVGRIDRGSRVTYLRRRFENVWLPAELSYAATGRTLLVRPFEVVATTTYSDYRRAASGPGRGASPPVQER